MPAKKFITPSVPTPTYTQAPIPAPAPNRWEGNNFILGGTRMPGRLPRGVGMGLFGMPLRQLRSNILSGNVPPGFIQQLYGMIGTPTPTKITPIRRRGLFGQ